MENPTTIPEDHPEVATFLKYCLDATPFEVELFRGRREHHEIFWASLQHYLASLGFSLRPRYSPTWVPSWRGKVGPGFSLYNYEDINIPISVKTIDAVRVCDGAKVVLKLVPIQTQEIEIASRLSSPPLQQDPRNHAVPILGTISIPGNPNQALLVMPMLAPFDIVPFVHLGEVVECLRQFAETLELMHEKNIAHRDACTLNLMVDATELLPKGSHFCIPDSSDGITSDYIHTQRSQVISLRHYLTDFGLSTQYPPNARNILDVGIFGQDRTVPEFSVSTPYDPFKVDIYHLGNAFRLLLENYRLEGTEPLVPLLAAMTATIPLERPTASQVVESLLAFDEKTRERHIRRKRLLDPDYVF